MGLGSGIRKKPIPDPGSRVKKPPDPRSRISNTDRLVPTAEVLSSDTVPESRSLAAWLVAEGRMLVGRLYCDSRTRLLGDGDGLKFPSPIIIIS